MKRLSHKRLLYVLYHSPGHVVIKYIARVAICYHLQLMADCISSSDTGALAHWYIGNSPDKRIHIVTPLRINDPIYLPHSKVFLRILCVEHSRRHERGNCQRWCHISGIRNVYKSSVRYCSVRYCSKLLAVRKQTQDCRLLKSKNDVTELCRTQRNTGIRGPTMH